MKKIYSSLSQLQTSLKSLSRTKEWADFNRYAESNKTAAKGSKAVFMGDSITEGWINQHPDFFKNNQFISRGINGQTTSQMLVRFRKDVIELNPKNVVILAGTNDIAQNNGYISNENILSNIASMCELANLHKINVVLCSVLPAAVYTWNKKIDAVTNICELNKLLKDYASINKFTYVDFYNKMKDSRNGLPKDHTSDEVHVTSKGYEIMAALILPNLK